MGAAKLARRRYDVLVRFLRETINNPKIAHRVRMAAAVRLDAIYERNETLSERAEQRKERGEARLADQAKAHALELSTQIVETDVEAKARQEAADTQRIKHVFATLTKSVESKVGDDDR
jgi:hypothetical protein